MPESNAMFGISTSEHRGSIKQTNDGKWSVTFEITNGTRGAVLPSYDEALDWIVALNVDRSKICQDGDRWWAKSSTPSPSDGVSAMVINEVNHTIHEMHLDVQKFAYLGTSIESFPEGSVERTVREEYGAIDRDIRLVSDDDEATAIATRAIKISNAIREARTGVTEDQFGAWTGRLHLAIDEIRSIYPELEIEFEENQMKVVYPVLPDTDWGFYTEEYPQFQAILETHGVGGVTESIDFDYGDDPYYDENHGFILYNLP